MLAATGLGELFEATVSSEEVPRGKPAPDVYLEAARRLGVPPERAAAVEDSANGIRSAHAAGLRVIAIPNRRYPPPEDALALADVVAARSAELTPEARERVSCGRGGLQPPPRLERNHDPLTDGKRNVPKA